jgi:hypothetical protein
VLNLINVSEILQLIEIKHIFWGLKALPHKWNNGMVEEGNDGKQPTDPQYGCDFLTHFTPCQDGFPIYHSLIIPKPIFAIFHCSNIPIARPKGSQQVVNEAN